MGSDNPVSQAVSSVVSTVTNAVAPVTNAVQDHVVAPVANTGKANLPGTTNVAVAAGEAMVTLGGSVVAQSQPAQSVLNSSTANHLTGGTSGQAALAAQGSGQLASGGNETDAQQNAALQFGVKYGATVATLGAGSAAVDAGLIAAPEVTGGEALIGSSLLLNGNASGAATAFGVPGSEFLPLIDPSSGAPAPARGGYNLGGNYSYSPTSPMATYYPQAPTSTDSGSGPDGTQASKIPPALVAGLGALVVLKMMGKI